MVTLYVSKELFELATEYLMAVDAGDMSENRTWLHDRMMAKMREEGIPYDNRDHARELARQMVPVPDKWEDVPVTEELIAAVALLIARGMLRVANAVALLYAEVDGGK